MNKPEIIILHHTAVSSARKQLNAVNSYHANHPVYGHFPLSSLGWYVGYHYFIERDGSYTQTRADSDEGVHTVGWNTKSIAICLAGDFNVEAPTQEQLKIVKRLLNNYDLPYFFHKDKQVDRTCAGIYFTRDAVNNIVTDKGAEDLLKRREIAKQLTLLRSLVEKLQALIKAYGQKRNIR